MSTAANPIYQYYQPPVQNAGYNTTNNPRQLVSNADEFAVNTGGQLLSQEQALANQYGQQQAGTQNYLNPIESNLAAGQGGYTPAEQSQIELTPAQEQAIATNAGISAGAGNAAAVGAAERAYAATGGNPAAMATYRARAAQSQAANTGQASTGAQVAAQQAGSAGAQAVGQAAQAQQGQALGYYGNLQAQQGSQAQTEQGLGQAAYGTETGALTGGLNAGVNASQTPTTADKIIGGIAGAAGAAGLADGTSGYLDDGQDAVVGENGIEAVLEDAPKAVQQGASDPVRSNTAFMDEGCYNPENNPPASSGATFMDNGFGVPGMSAPPQPQSPVAAPPAQPQAPASPGISGSGMPAWLQQVLAKGGQQPQQAAPAAGQPGWNKTTPYSQLGSAIGTGAKFLMQHPGAAPQGGGFAPGSTQMPAQGTVPYSDSNPRQMIPRDADSGATLTPDASAPATDLSSFVYADGRAPQYLDDGAFSPAQTPFAPGGTPGGPDAEGAGALIAGTGNLINRAFAVGKPLVQGAAEFAAEADGKVPQYLDGAPESDLYRDDPQNSSEVSRLISEEAESMADGRMMAGGRMGSGFHWSNRMPHQPHVPAGGYQPLRYEAKPMLADGDTGYGMPKAPTFNPADAMDSTAPQGGQVPNGSQVGSAKVFTKPTLIHLEKADAVIPLTYRPKAKVRPSAALPALKSQFRPRRVA